MIRRMWSTKKGRIGLLSFAFFLFVALAADFLANEKPLIAQHEGETYFPALRSELVELGLSEWPEELRGIDWRNADFERAIYPPVPYSPQNTDPRNSGTVSPLADQEISSRWERHWLGTDQLGRDLLAGMIHGSRTALIIGLGAMGLAAVLGLFIGSLAGHFGDHRVRISVGSLFSGIPILFLAAFYAFYVRGYTLSESIDASTMTFLGECTISLGILFLGLLLSKGAGRGLGKLPLLRRQMPLPVDLLLMRLVDILLAIPSLFLLLGLLAVLGKASLLQLSLVIGLLSWCRIARLTRAEYLRIRELPYFEAAKAIGASELRTILRHALPNLLSPLLIAVNYGIATAILTASALSFLGLTPADMTSWGALLAQARSETMAWWLVLFPGLGIFALVWTFNLLAEALDKKH